MPRTRDFILFAVCVLFLFSAINVTLYLDRDASTREVISFAPSQTTDDAVSRPTETLDRASIIEQLKARLAADSDVTLVDPSVTTAADAIEAVASSTEVVAGGAQARYCVYPDDTMPNIGRWPLEGASMNIDGSTRTFYTEEEVTTAAQSSSTPAEVEVVETTLLTLPTNPAFLGASNCLPSAVVGVTNGGILLFNSDVRQYASWSSQQLIGYARDGFPIYGSYEGAVDECGGYRHPAGYRYTLSPDREYLVGCYQGVVQSFTF